MLSIKNSPNKKRMSYNCKKKLVQSKLSSRTAPQLVTMLQLRVLHHLATVRKEADVEVESLEEAEVEVKEDHIEHVENIEEEETVSIDQEENIEVTEASTANTNQEEEVSTEDVEPEVEDQMVKIKMDL